MGLLDLLKKNKEDKEELKHKFKEAQDNIKINRIIEERQKSSNERELERYMKEAREEQIKNKLNQIRQRNQSEMWSGRNSILNDKKNIIKQDCQILKQKNIFKSNNVLKEGILNW